jgi:hypothetical protein
MPIILQKMIFREDLRANPQTLYLFGDNDSRKGLGGQAKEMRGEPNAVGVRTKHQPSNSSQAFWSDGNFDCNRAKIEHDLERAINHLRNGGIVIVPMDGLGTGLARLDEVAPLTFAYLRDRLADLVDINPD